MQLTADIFGLPAERPHLYETCGLGAAINCAVGLGLHPDYPSAIAAMTRVGQVFQPNPSAPAPVSSACAFPEAVRRAMRRCN